LFWRRVANDGLPAQCHYQRTLRRWPLHVSTALCCGFCEGGEKEADEESLSERLEEVLKNE